MVNIASLGVLNRRSIGEGVDRLRAQLVDGIIIVAPHESAAEGLCHLSPTCRWSRWTRGGTSPSPWSWSTSAAAPYGRRGTC